MWFATSNWIHMKIESLLCRSQIFGVRSRFFVLYELYTIISCRDIQKPEPIRDARFLRTSPRTGKDFLRCKPIGRASLLHAFVFVSPFVRIARVFQSVLSFLTKRLAYY